MLVVSDLHWGVMQAVAWATMVEQSTEEISLCEKVARTISGKKPCHRCLHVQTGRNSEEEQSLDLVAKSQLLAPVETARHRFSHPGTALFTLPTDGSRQAGGEPEAIEKPPRA